ncbi:hypothetical protein POJ06DRAFT_219618 [Lipomyces tetrasporus]|uniref:NmrA-like domain-containing protein n=1 Tax=Lipomyces tetrasporus TaxID=54092 RepID=A0AAD7QYH6_9ASCO|nr:uncharacterized protein POJ06DRAFT_219618 [Lipomyces tetrasporus]KAJ8103356.1 hypothetical protein POJ06DRAFT_219618 [Lipomyces tetrasporus]
MSDQKKTILVIGGTGAQGSAVVKALAQDGKYEVRAITRSTASNEAKALAKLPNVTLFQGNPYNEVDLQKAFKGVRLAFANTNGFAIGEKAEIYWGIRMYELAAQNGLEHFVWAGVDYGSKLGGFAPKYRCGHLDGKNKVTEYLKSQPQSPLAWSVLSSCPYIEMLSENWRPKKDKTGTYVFAVPLGYGASPLIHLEDLGHYARWIFDNPAESKGINLEVATCHVGLDDLVQTFQKVTGKPARAVRMTPEEYFANGYEPLDTDKKLAYGTDGSDSTLMTAGQNFIGFFYLWRDNLAKRDYALLDKILPTRVKTLEEWMRKSDYTGEYKPVLIDVARGNFPIKGQ